MTRSAYTMEELLAFKSLDSYNYFISGLVQYVGHVVINDNSLFLGKVKHSQRMSEQSLQPWIIVQRDGQVLCAHCTCMAGIGEVCSHVGAILFYIDCQVKRRENKTVTDEKAYWMLPSSINKVASKSVQEIDFTSAKTKKRKLDEVIESETVINSGPKQRKMPHTLEPSKEELDSLFFNLHRGGSNSAILAVVPQYADSYRPKALSQNFPQVLTELYEENFSSMSKEETESRIEDVFKNLAVSEEEARNCQIATQQQAKNKLWFNFRAGRITASRAKRACRTSSENPSKSLITDICYPFAKAFSNKATKWGCEHEQDAKNEYLKTMSGKHQNLTWHDTGLVINPLYPFMGASPDGKVTCDCCDDVLVEIKCPFCKRSESVTDDIDCLQSVDGQLTLNRDHAYFYQVQCQLLLVGLQFCDFVVWTERDFFHQRISIEPDFCTDMVNKCTVFFKKAILPEILGKAFSKPLQGANSTHTQPQDSSANKLIICTCKSPFNEETDDVIGCDNENCPYGWLHFKCAGIRRVPKGKWYCKDCRKKK